MSPIVRAITIVFGVLSAAFGSSLTRTVDRSQLEQAIGRKGTVLVLALPVLTVVAWLIVWAFGKFTGTEGAGDPFAWWRSLLQSPDP
jgi:hypothetical protein